MLNSGLVFILLGLEAIVVPMKKCRHADVLKAVNEEEMNTDCPTSCPSRDVMVCAACQHGVYRTFLSTCHMRMYGCHHTGESECTVAPRARVRMLSAPYIPAGGGARAGRGPRARAERR
ncbi:Uncharacterized protein OBRU01_04504 [Operophtera brumata]|uniref:Secreted protein n=1 Tax=Operophtera brumata TaxID=104452 RepID=A0A0L7LQ27_OPEBR|nr:Uncharacterized protein OBRU01_04504 [Operophtera brumata]